MKYSELNLDPVLFSAIEKLGYTDATPIQEQAMPHILAGKDVAGLAQTGTGKTAAFLIPLIERILRTKQDPTHERAFKDWNARSFVLVLVPTRELADQINDNAVKLMQGTGFKSFPVYGGTGYDKQKEAISSGLQFLISTPGRMIDLYKENHIDLKQVKAIVFDEADRMFDMGFKDDMKYILGRVPRERQFLVFSATLNFDVLNTAYQFGAEPVEINISRDQAKADHVKDFIIHLGDQEKAQFLLSLLKKHNPKQAMIFTNFKHNVDKIAAFLISNKISAMGISSLMSQSQRNQVIEKFKADNDQNILVATDVAARGLDINGVDLVINFEMPQDAESYVHRIGRTGRAGREGQAFSLISDKDIDSLSRVEEYTKKKIEAQYMEDADLVKEFTAFSHHEPNFHKKFDRGPRGGGRGGRDDKRGPRRDRNDRGGERGERPQRGPRPQGAQPQQAAGATAASGERPQQAHQGSPAQHAKGGKPHHQHDRNKPRQGGQPGPHKHANANGQHQGPKQVQRPQQKQNNSQAPKNFRSGGGSRRVANESIGQKVKSFFKRLFS
jgi:ATP-dependent RNA helicase RhlE